MTVHFDHAAAQYLAYVPGNLRRFFLNCFLAGCSKMPCKHTRTILSIPSLCDSTLQLLVCNYTLALNTRLPTKPNSIRGPLSKHGRLSNTVEPKHQYKYPIPSRIAGSPSRFEGHTLSSSIIMNSQHLRPSTPALYIAERPMSSTPTNP